MGYTHHDGVAVNSLAVGAPLAAVTPVTASTSAMTANAIIASAVVTLTSAQIKALQTTAQTLIAAPPAGFAIDLLSFVAELLYGSVTYTDAGGAVNVIEGSGNALVTGTELASVITNGSSLVKSLLLTDNVTLTSATAVTLTKATNNYAAGNGTLKLTLLYAIIAV
jgi:hypothetical protein